MANQRDVPLLVIGYQRTESVVTILESALSSGITRLFISVDYPAKPDSHSIEVYQQITKIVAQYNHKFQMLKSRFLESNQGCALHVLSSIDWAFEFVDELVILEDDCIPSPAFFDFVRDGLSLMKSHSDIVLICGTQHIPRQINSGQFYKSKYALTWGWATNHSSWEVIKLNMSAASSRTPLNLRNFNAGVIYWQEGARRAYKGYVDVWDTPLVNYLQTSDKYALLPSENLISNIGNDLAATHMSGEDTWLFKEVGKYNLDIKEVPETNQNADDWLAINFFRIRTRHLITTRVTRLMDYFRKPGRSNLLSRWVG